MSALYDYAKRPRLLSKEQAVLGEIMNNALELHQSINDRVSHARYLPVSNLRFVDDDNVIEGVASAFGVIEEYYNTMFQHGAFRKTITERASDVLLLYQHDLRQPLGKILSLRETQAGLEFRARISLTSYGADALQLLRDGAIQDISIGFEPVKSRMLDVDGKTIRVFTEVRLLEISLVTIGANPGAKLFERTPYSEETRGIDDAPNLGYDPERGMCQGCAFVETGDGLYLCGQYDFVTAPQLSCDSYEPTEMVEIDLDGMVDEMDRALHAAAENKLSRDDVVALRDMATHYAEQFGVISDEEPPSNGTLEDDRRRRLEMLRQAQIEREQIAQEFNNVDT